MMSRMPREKENPSHSHRLRGATRQIRQVGSWLPAGASALTTSDIRKRRDGRSPDDLWKSTGTPIYKQPKDQRDQVGQHLLLAEGPFLDVSEPTFKMTNFPANCGSTHSKG